MGEKSIPQMETRLASTGILFDVQRMELELHAVLKREMKAKGITLNALSKATGTPVASLHGWLAKRPPSGKNLVHLHKIATFFGMSLTSLLFNIKEDGSTAKVLFRSEFVDADKRYRLLIEKVE